MPLPPLELGVNIDHVATLRQARGTRYPDPIDAALLAERAGADGITLHCREDRRHIQDRDLLLLADIVQTRLNFECAVSDEMIAMAVDIKPYSCCFVPERREELTTEGGLAVASQQDKIAAACATLQQQGILVSLFIEPEKTQIDAAKHVGADCVELHTGAYADAPTRAKQQVELARLAKAAAQANACGLQVNAGHGLHYHNVQAVAAIELFQELNIGHAIIARAVLTGMDEAVRTMRACMREGRGL